MSLNKKELQQIARQLQAALDIIRAELAPIQVPDDITQEVRRKIEARICLAWDHEIPAGERVMRGLCETDYHTTMARIRRGDESERDLMMRGELDFPGKAGRKAARDVADAEKLRIVAEDAARYNAKQAKRRKGTSNE